MNEHLSVSKLCAIYIAANFEHEQEGHWKDWDFSMDYPVRSVRRAACRAPAHGPCKARYGQSRPFFFVIFFVFAQEFVEAVARMAVAHGTDDIERCFVGLTVSIQGIQGTRGTRGSTGVDIGEVLAS
jgi:hypothetical protein